MKTRQSAGSQFAGVRRGEVEGEDGVQGVPRVRPFDGLAGVWVEDEDEWAGRGGPWKSGIEPLMSAVRAPEGWEGKGAINFGQLSSGAASRPENRRLASFSICHPDHDFSVWATFVPLG